MTEQTRHAPRPDRLSHTECGMALRPFGRNHRTPLLITGVVREITCDECRHALQWRLEDEISRIQLQLNELAEATS